MSPSIWQYFLISISRRCRLHAVLASLPKNTRRMSLSMPTRSKPWAAKNHTDSAPINPADPVTSTMLILASTMPILSEHRFNLGPVLNQPLEYFIKDYLDRAGRGPTCCLRDRRGVGNVIWD